jgi:superfamily I DNA/RNA helicase
LFRAVSVFSGPEPTVEVLENAVEEMQAAAKWLGERQAAGVRPDEIGIFVRSEAQIPRAVCAAETAGLKAIELDQHVETQSGHVSIGTLHLAKELEFQAVALMACDDQVLPLQERIDAVGDEGDLEEVFNTERHLFYVGCTRARDHLLVTGVKPASEFLDDLKV